MNKRHLPMAGGYHIWKVEQLKLGHTDKFIDHDRLTFILDISTFYITISINYDTARCSVIEMNQNSRGNGRAAMARRMSKMKDGLSIRLYMYV